MEDEVVCMVCGRSFKHITNTHLKTHGMTVDSYKEMFPDTSMISEKTCINHTNGLIRRYEDPDERRKTSIAIKNAPGNPEKHKKSSERLKKVWNDPDERNRRIASIKRARGTEESREKTSIATIKRYEDLNTRKKQSDTLKKWAEEHPEACKEQGKKTKAYYNEHPEAREILGQKITKYWSNPEAREKASIAQIKRYEDPDERKKLSTSIKKAYEDPEKHKEASERSKRMWKDPEKRNRIVASLKKAYENPDLRKMTRDRFSGENHYNWQGGISFGKYCHKFNASIKQKIRDKYNNCDFMSGLPDYICNKCGYNLDIHHVDYNKQQGCDEHEWKLIPLSKINHGKTQKTKPFWSRLFTYALQYDEEYYADEPIDMFLEIGGGTN
jgi:hypothetical protein